MKKKLAATLVALMIPMNLLFGQSYTSLWQQVKKAQEQDLPQTEQEALRKIVRKAEREKAYGQLLKAELTEARSLAAVSPDSLLPAVERLARRETALGDPVLRAVYQTVLGTLYQENHQLADDAEARSKTYFDQALSRPALLAAVKATGYEPFVVKGDDSRFFDFDLLSVIGMESGQWEPLHRYYLTTGNREAQLYTALALLRQERQKQPEYHLPWSNQLPYVQQLDSLIERYADLPMAAEVAMERYRYMAEHTDATAQQQTAYIDEALARWPSWTRINELRNARAQLTARQFNATLEHKVNIPQREQQVRLTNLRAVNELTVRLYRVKADGDIALRPYYDEEYKQLKALLTELPELTQTRRYTGHADYELFDDSLTLPALPVGVYLVEAQTRPETHVARRLLFVSDVRLLQQPLPNNQIRYVVVNATTGQLIKGATVRLRTGYGTRSHSQTTTLTTDARGECLHTYRSSKRPTESFVKTTTDRYCPVVHSYGSYGYYEREDERQQAVLYTDRAIYRPGQTVHAAAIFYNTSHGFEHKALEGHQCTMVLRDANWKEVASQTVVTDRYGTCSADFTLPTQGLMGRFTVQADGFSQSFRVEEYKRPTFQVEFQPYEQDYKEGDTIQVRATARSYAGVPVQGARVNYKVVRRRAFWWLTYWRYWQGGYIGVSEDDEQIANGTAETGDDGTFSVDIPLRLPSSRYPLFYNFVVTADVTDQGGETHHGELSLPLGNRTTVLTADLSDKVQRELMTPTKFHLRNAAGNDIDATVRYCIESLPADGAAPRKESRERKWKETPSNTPVSLPALKSGRYRLVAIALPQEGDTAAPADTLEHEFVVFSENDRKPAVVTDDWFWQSATQFPNDGGGVTLQVGSSASDMHIVYTVFTGNTVLESGSVEKSDELVNRKFYYKEEYGNGLFVTYAWIKEGRTYQHTAQIRRPLPDMQLQLRWDTFRDRLQPGQQEEWKLRVETPEGKAADAQLMATLYDKSLDQLAPHSWQLQPNVWLPLPSTEWHYGSWGKLELAGYWNAKTLNTPALSFCRFDHDCYPSRWYHRAADELLEGRLAGATRGSAFRLRRAKASAPLMNQAMTETAAEAKADVAIGAFDVAAAPAEADEEQATGADDATLDQVSLRENLQETAFFYPQLTTDASGSVALKFTLPESLTTWRFIGLAHTPDLKRGTLQGETVAQKDMMVQPNMPRFLRMGDEGSITAKVFNTTDHPLTATTRLQLIDPDTEAVLLEQQKPVSVEANGTGSVAFSINTSALGLQNTQSLLIAKVVVAGQGFSDGEQHYLPILPDRERVTVTVPFTQNGPGTKVIDLSTVLPADIRQPKLTVEYTNNPAWLMVQALPTMAKPYEKDAISQAASVYANTLGNQLLQQNPRAKHIFEQWSREQGTETSLQSNLAKDQDLKDLLLSETPWVFDADKEHEQKQRLGDFFDENLIQTRLHSATTELRKLQNGDGSWSWWPGMPGSMFMTIGVSELMVRLNQMVGHQDNTAAMLNKAFKYLGNEMVELVDEMKREEKKEHPQSFPSHTALEWLYICAVDGRQQPSRVQQANDYLKKLLRKDIKVQTIYEKALSAIVLESKDYVRSLKEYTVYREDMGRYYDTPRASYSWRSYRIPTQVAAIEALQRLTPADTLTIDEMQRWLLQEKRTQAWETPLSSVDAIYAFLNRRPQVLTPQPKTVLTIDGQPLETSDATAGIGYVKTVLHPQGAKTFKAEKASEGTSWGALYAQFMQKTTSIADHTTSGIRVKREIIASPLPSPLSPLTSQNSPLTSHLSPLPSQNSPLTSHLSPLTIGSRITVRITIENDRDLDFVQVVDRRAACMEPIQPLSGYHRGIYYSPKDYTTCYYYDKLAKGKHVIEAEYYIDRAGRYETGTCTVQCAYAPEFRGTTKSQTITVTK